MSENSSSQVANQGFIIQTRRLQRDYTIGDRTIHALRGVDLDIMPERIAALKGRSGSGKTTLLNMIGGLDRPTSGTVSFAGVSLSSLDDGQLTRLPTYSAFENVELMLRLAGLRRRERDQRARRCLSVVGLEKWMHHRPDEMS